MAASSSAILVNIIADILNDDMETAMRKITENHPASLIYLVDSSLQWSLLAYAIRKQHGGLVDFLLKHMEHDVLIGNLKQTSITFCVVVGTESILTKLLMKFGDNINDTDEGGISALAMSIMMGNYEMTKRLLQAGATDYLNVNKQALSECKNERILSLFDKHS